jgi:hypothetical protein
MNKKFLYSLIIAYALFLVVSVNATDILLSFPSGTRYSLRKIDINKYDDVSGKFNSRIDSFHENQDIMFTVEFTGWAFIQTEKGNGNKSIKLIFSSEDNRYEVDTALQERFDLKKLFNENNIYGLKHGFTTKFSPLKMENDIYKLYIYCYENEEVTGLIDTGKLYKKTYRGFTEYEDVPVIETTE